MPPTTKIKKFLKMRKDKISDLTLALDRLFEKPEERIGQEGLRALRDDGNCLKHPLNSTIWTKIQGALGEVQSDVPVEPSKPEKVKEHIEDWRDQDGKEYLRQKLVDILDRVLNSGEKYKVNFHWALFEQEGNDRIDIDERRDEIDESTTKVDVWFLNSWERVTGEIDIRVG